MSATGKNGRRRRSATRLSSSQNKGRNSQAERRTGHKNRATCCQTDRKQAQRSQKKTQLKWRSHTLGRRRPAAVPRSQRRTFPGRPRRTRGSHELSCARRNSPSPTRRASCRSRTCARWLSYPTLARWRCSAVLLPGGDAGRGDAAATMRVVRGGVRRRRDAKAARAS